MIARPPGNVCVLQARMMMRRPPALTPTEKRGFSPRRELLVGAGSVQFLRAFSTAGQSYDALEAPMIIGRYWYPAWRASTDYLPGGRPLTEKE